MAKRYLRVTQFNLGAAPCSKTTHNLRNSKQAQENLNPLKSIQK